MHATLEKFGYPHGCILESTHWAVLLRPVQCTLGALVLCSKSDALAFPSLPAGAFAELADVCHRLENALKQAFSYEKINYLMLMMVDPQVHFHVLPRYPVERVFAGHPFPDPGWPGPPELAAGIALDDALATSLKAALREHLAAPGAAAEPGEPSILKR
ncbi:MAG: hypothetical protein RIC38_02445 [Chromatocurvus sp.]